MSGIVAWLAARSLPGTRGVAADDGAAVLQVRPWLPGRYESDATGSPALLEEVAHEAAPAATSPVPRTAAPANGWARQRSEPEHQSQQRPVAVPPMAMVEPRASEHSTPRANAIQDVEQPAAKAAPPASDLSIEKSRNGFSPPTNSAPQIAPPAIPRPPSPASHETGQRHPAPQRHFVQEKRRATPVKPSDTAPHETPRPTPPPVVIAPAQRSAVAPAEPIVAPRADRPRPPAPSVAAATNAHPRVQVTIERLEIRAATAAPPPPHRLPPRPYTMSLDAYLADRGKG